MLGDNAIELTMDSTIGILPRGGTILGTSRTNPYAGGADGTTLIREALARRRRRRADPDRRRRHARRRDHAARGRVPIVGVPKTIDNDLGGTDFTFGFQTAVQIVDRRDRPPAHDRRVTRPRDGRRGDGPPRGLDRHVRRARRRRRRDPRARAPVRHRAGVRHLRRRHGRGRKFSIVVVAEGATPVEGTLGSGTGPVTGATTTTPSDTRGSAGSAPCSSARSSRAPASRRA